LKDDSTVYFLIEINILNNNLTIWTTLVSNKITTPTIKAKKNTIKLITSVNIEIDCSHKNNPIKPCLNKAREAINMIKNPKKMLASFKNIFILVNKNEIKSSKNGIKTEANPK
jgi:hypothetical protein